MTLAGGLDRTRSQVLQARDVVRNRGVTGGGSGFWGKATRENSHKRRFQLWTWGGKEKAGAAVQE